MKLNSTVDYVSLISTSETMRQISFSFISSADNEVSSPLLFVDSCFFSMIQFSPVPHVKCGTGAGLFSQKKKKRLEFKKMVELERTVTPLSNQQSVSSAEPKCDRYFWISGRLVATLKVVVQETNKLTRITECGRVGAT